jgi:prevent-host-death family protein
MIDVPIAEAHNQLSALLKRVQTSPITLTRRGKPVGVLLSPEEYERRTSLKPTARWCGFPGPCAIAA